MAQPTSVAIKTASYTITAGYYAVIRVELVADSSKFTIGGVVAMEGCNSRVGEFTVPAGTVIAGSGFRAVVQEIANAA